MKRSDPKPPTEPQGAAVSRRARLQALLFQGAALGAAILMALPDIKMPRSQGE